MPATSVHCCTSSRRLVGETVPSVRPCHTETRGRVPVNDVNAERTRMPHVAGVRSTPSRQLCAPPRFSVHLYGTPATIAPALKRSGCAASRLDVAAAPAEKPTTKTCWGSLPTSVTMRSIICVTESNSPEPRDWLVASNQLKQVAKLLLLCCCGTSSANRLAVACASSPLPVENAAAVSPQPWSNTTSGRPEGRPAGTNRYMSRLPGFEPKLVTASSPCRVVATSGESMEDTPHPNEETRRTQSSRCMRSA